MTTTYDTIHQAGHDLARMLAERGHGHVAVEPGTGARYDVYVQEAEDGQHVVTLPVWRAGYTFTLGYQHPDYVEQKLRVTGVDADVMAELIEAVGVELHNLTAPPEVARDPDGTVIEAW